MYRIRLPDDTKYVSVHLAHIKSYRPRQSAPVPNLHKLGKLFLEKTLPTPAFVLMLSVIGVYKGGIIPIIIYVVYGSRASAQNLISNTELTRYHNIKNLLQNTELNIRLRKSRFLLATSESISLRKTTIPSEVISHRKTVVPSNANALLSSVNPDLARIKREIIRRGEHE